MTEVIGEAKTESVLGPVPGTVPRVPAVPAGRIMPGWTCLSWCSR
ncbi:hypothetical protein AHiyo4_01720 [Arthrobacter sp. Hiyo4]|nr:hypothetical protein AHiyo4_01720 [Arthrobacter sp. Hiyo4]